MKIPKKPIIILVLVGGVVGGIVWLSIYWRGLSQTKYRDAEVSRGTITAVVNATGTVQPVLSVSVGSFVSGPIKKLYADFNKEVKENELLAEIDPLIYDAAVAQGDALLKTRQGELKSAIALMEQARNDYIRARQLHMENKEFIAASEIDKYKFSYESLKAQVAVAEANIKQAEASLKTAEANLGYTKIRSPVNGIVIKRSIDEGQTLASQFQTPELFIVAPDMKTTMFIIATVDEADIGKINTARKQQLADPPFLAAALWGLLGTPGGHGPLPAAIAINPGKPNVQFTVDSYPKDLFEGSIYQIRMSSTTTQNVVTYPVVVVTTNLELKLMPGMTASLSFQVGEAKDTLRIPNAALRFYPQREKVRPEDRKILEGIQPDTQDDNDLPQTKQSAQEKAQGRKDTHKRHVWVVDGQFLRAIEIITGLSDSKYTELVSGNVTAGQKLVTGIMAAE